VRSSAGSCRSVCDRSRRDSIAGCVCAAPRGEGGSEPVAGVAAVSQEHLDVGDGGRSRAEEQRGRAGAAPRGHWGKCSYGHEGARGQAFVERMLTEVGRLRLQGREKRWGSWRERSERGGRGERERRCWRALG
jgi:hypothetical protein